MAAEIVIPVLDVLVLVLRVINWVVLFWVVLSWAAFIASQTSFRWRYRSAYNILNQLNDIFSRMAHPFLKPFRRFLRRFDTAGIDWSPMLLWLTILLLQALVAGIERAILRASVPGML